MSSCLVLLSLVFFSLPAAAQDIDSQYLTGYARALLDVKFNLPQATVQADQETLLIHLPPGHKDLQEPIRKALLNRFPDQVQVQLKTQSEPMASKPEPGRSSPGKSEFLPEEPLFQALMADPRWPHFSASYQRYLDQDELENVGHTSFGETFVFYRRNSTIRWELGLQAGVFAIFDLDAESYDLINADYRVSLPLSLRWNALSANFRVLHQSSHLGDEFILRGRAEDRENLSYEKVDGLLSIDLPLKARLYAGGGYIFHKDPSDLEPWSAQGGLEWVCPYGFFDGAVHPLAAVDVQSEEENDWGLDVSAKAGLQLGSRGGKIRNRLQLTLEYYQGHSPNGQFYDESVEHIGLGLHYYR